MHTKNVNDFLCTLRTIYDKIARCSIETSVLQRGSGKLRATHLSAPNQGTQAPPTAPDSGEPGHTKSMSKNKTVIRHSILSSSAKQMQTFTKLKDKFTALFRQPRVELENQLRALHSSTKTCKLRIQQLQRELSMLETQQKSEETALEALQNQLNMYPIPPEVVEEFESWFAPLRGHRYNGQTCYHFGLAIPGTHRALFCCTRKHPVQISERIQDLIDRYCIEVCQDTTVLY
jgi:hypothetical protein